MRSAFIFVLVSITASLWGCKTSAVDTIVDEDYLVLNSTLVHLFTIAPEGHERQFGYHNHELSDGEIPEELIRKAYVVPFLFSVSDTLGFSQPARIDIEKIQDATFRSLAKQLFEASPVTQPLELSKITNTGLNRIVAGERHAPRESRSIYSCSRIVYQQGKACFYFEDQCRGMCGRGVLVLVEKVDGIWEIKEEVYGWVS